jgi:hypothetical protein
MLLLKSLIDPEATCASAQLVHNSGNGFFWFEHGEHGFFSAKCVSRLFVVFLQYQFTDLRSKEPEDKMVDILQKTWKKMSDNGRAAALELAPSLCAEEFALVQKALA